MSMFSDPYQNRELESFRRHHRPIFQPRDNCNPVIMPQPNFVPQSNPHLICLSQLSSLQSQASTLRSLLDKLTSQKQQLQLKVNSLSNKVQPQQLRLSSERELLAKLKTQNTVLKEQLKEKWMREAKEKDESEEDRVRQKARELDVGVTSQRLDEEIKALKKAIQDGEDRLKTYQIKVNPADVTQLERQNDLLKKQILSTLTQPGPNPSQYTLKDYSALKSSNQLLIQKVTQKAIYLQQLQKRSDGLNSQQMIYERTNQQMQFEITRYEPRISDDDEYKYRHRLLSQKYQALQAEYMRLQKMVRAGQNMEGEIKAYSWALANQDDGSIQALPFEKDSLMGRLPYF